MIKVVVDLLGADKSEEELLGGAIKAINENDDLFVYVAGHKKVIEEKLKDYSYNANQLEIIDSMEEVTNLDSPTRAFKAKPNSSLILGLKKSKEEADAFVSCGSTGACLVSSMFIVGRIEGCSRPTLASLLLNQNEGKLCLTDCGANVDCKVEQLEEFAKMGVAFMKANGVENPRVALLNNGKEEKKGNEQTKAAYQLLKSKDFNFIGNVEGSAALSGECDVIVADGFSGNILLKSIEGAAKTVFKDLFKMAKTSSSEEGKILLKAVNSLMHKYDYNSKGGAVLLGINKVLVKGHGAGNDETIYSCIKMAYELSKNGLVDKIKEMY